MDFFLGVFQLIPFFLLSCEVRDCYKVDCTGEVTVDQDTVPIGSNLTVHCRSETVQCGRLFVVKFNGKEVLRKTSCSKVTAQVVVNEPNSRLYCAVEQKGILYIVCGRDILANPIPSPPHIDKITFAKGSLSPTIHWHSSDNTENLKPVVRLYKRHGASGWRRGNLSQLHRGTLVLLEKLEPLTFYEFKLRVCTASMENNCSLWSKPFDQTSPGKAPSTKLDVWRIIMRNEHSYTQNVTVMWKPLNKEDYNGVLQHYEIVYQEKGTTHLLNCSTDIMQYTLQVPLEVTELNVSAVTSAGSSPPALVRLACSAAIPSPEINSSHAAGGSINLMWDTPHFSDRALEQMLGFVVQWQCTPFQIQWKRMKKNYNSVYIHDTQLTMCNISLYVESSNGLSCSSFKQIHPFKKDSEGMNSIPDLKIIQRSHSSANKTKNGLAVWICLITAIPLIIILNLMYIKCARQRMRKACMSMGPSWLFQDLPKLGNSNAIKLLKDERCGSDLCCQPVDSDPPLSPVEDYSPPVIRRDLYPVVHKEVTTEERIVQDWTVCPYKPQITISQGAEAECGEKEEDEPWVVFSSSVFNTVEQHFLPSQGMHAPLPSCLTVDGRPVSMNLVDGFPLFSPATLDENMWTGGFVQTGNGDQNQQQSLTVLPNSLVRCLREPLFNNTPSFPVQRSLHPLQVEEQLL